MPWVCNAEVSPDRAMNGIEPCFSTARAVVCPELYDCHCPFADAKIVSGDGVFEPISDFNYVANVQIVATFLQDDVDDGGHNVFTVGRSMNCGIH